VLHNLLKFDENNLASFANYRPISLTSVASKIMECVISVQMTSFLSQNNVINRVQHGFSPRLIYHLQFARDI